VTTPKRAALRGDEVRTTVLLPPDVLQAAKAYATARGTTLRAVVERALRRLVPMGVVLLVLLTDGAHAQTIGSPFITDEARDEKQDARGRVRVTMEALSAGPAHATEPSPRAKPGWDARDCTAIRKLRDNTGPLYPDVKCEHVYVLRSPSLDVELVGGKYRVTVKNARRVRVTMAGEARP
jgi:hypothetical protein